MKATRTRIEPNIYQYPDGRREVRLIHAGREAPTTRFAAEVPLAQIRAWIVGAKRRLEQDARELGERPDRRSSGGTLEGDAPEYLSQIAGRVSTRADTSHLRAWFEVLVDGVRLGGLPRSVLTTAHVNKTIGQWQATPSPHAIRRVRIRAYARTSQAIDAHDRRAPATSGRVVSALTIRHRCRVLKDLYRTLDGPDAPTPVDYAKIPKRTKNPPATVPAPNVVAVLEALRARDAKTFARFYVHATTAQRPCQIGRARPEDVQLAQRIWLVRNAKGEPAHCIMLNPQQVAAWDAFIAADAWSADAGGFDTSEYGKRIHAAGWPKGIRPYAARHSLARDAISRGVSLGDVQALLGHTDPTTTRIYAPFQVDRQRVVSDLMTPYLAEVLKPRLVKGQKDR
jgi:integrase